MKIKKEKGSILVLSLLVTAVLTLMGSIFLMATLTNYKWVMINGRELKAYWYAYAGINKAIYDLRDAYYDNDCKIEEQEFADGKYKIVVSSYESTGTHDILMLSTGEFEDEKVVVSSRIRLDTVSDYLYFFDGNGRFFSRYDPVFVAGPVHSNGNVMFKTYDDAGWGAGSERTNVKILKPYDIFGPTLSANGLVYIEDNGSWYTQWPKYIGEGNISFNGFTNNSSTPQYMFPNASYTLNTCNNQPDYPPDADYPSLTPITTRIPDYFPGTMTSPDNNWTMTENTPGGLLRDKYHKGYRINVPTIRRIDPTVEYTPSEYADLSFKTETEWNKTLYDWYFPYISKDGEKFYIKAHKDTDGNGNTRVVIDNPRGFSTKMFVCDGYRKKWSLGRGGNTAYNLPQKETWYPSGYEKLGFQNNSNNTTINILCRRKPKNIYVGNNLVAQAGTIPGNPLQSSFMAYYEQASNYAGGSVATRSKIAFDTPPASGYSIAVTFPSSAPLIDINMTMSGSHNLDDVSTTSTEPYITIPVRVAQGSSTPPARRNFDFYPRLNSDPARVFPYTPSSPDRVYVGSGSQYGGAEVWTVVDPNNVAYYDDIPTITFDSKSFAGGRTTAQCTTVENQHFANLLRTDYLSVSVNGTEVYYAIGSSVTKNTGNIVYSVDFLNGKVVFNGDQTAVPVTATYTRRMFRINPPSSAPSDSYNWWLTNVGVAYNGNEPFIIAVADGTMKEFNIPFQHKLNKIKEVIVNGIRAVCVIADYTDASSAYYNKIVFTPNSSYGLPPLLAQIQTDWLKRVYVHRSTRIDKPDRSFGGAVVDIENLTATEYSTITNTSNPPLNLEDVLTTEDSMPPMVPWWNYILNNNTINFRPIQLTISNNSLWDRRPWGGGTPYTAYPPIPSAAQKLNFNTISGAPSSDKYVLVDPCVNAVVIDLSSMNSYPSSGVLYSEAPLIIKGKAKAPITIVCLEDVFVQSINNTGTDDDPSAYPVGIISGKGVWIDYSSTFEDDMNNNSHTSNPKTIFDVTLNKVALFCTRGMYYYGSRGSQSRFKLIGSICQLANDVHRLEQDFKDDYADYRTQQSSVYKPFYYTGTQSAQPVLYAKSFRGADATQSGIHQPPPHMPVDIRIANFSGNVNPDAADQFIESVKGYIENKEPIPASIYQSFVTELEQ
jgi:hypothetical protein